MHNAIHNKLRLAMIITKPEAEAVLHRLDASIASRKFSQTPKVNTADSAALGGERMFLSTFHQSS